MADILLKGTPITTVGDLPQVGEKAPDFDLVGSDLEPVKSSDFLGHRVILNIFPSIDTGVCSTSVRRFNELAANLANTKVVCISKDLPFALARFCAAEGIENVVTASAFRSSFGEDYRVTMTSGPLRGLLSRSVIVLDETGVVMYCEQVPEIGQEPNYEAALKALI